MIDLALLTAMMMGVAAAAIMVARSPIFWLGLARVIISAATPNIWKIIKPRNMTQAEKDKYLRGEDPFSDRPFGRQKGQ
jgi:hypothetical protein